VEKNSKPKLLILGLHSSLAPELIVKAKIKGFEIYGTTHRRDNLKFTLKDQLSGIFDLQLDDLEVSKVQLEKIGSHKYERVVSLIGATWKNSGEISYKSLSNYYQTLSLNLNLVHEKIIRFIDLNGTFLFMSSRAATHGSFDEHYAAVKAANTSFLMSLQRHTSSSVKIIPIACSLIEASSMYEKMSPVNQELHRERTRNRLVKIEEVIDILLRENFMYEESNFQNGIYRLGRDLN
jgi:hypothetical protein